MVSCLKAFFSFWLIFVFVKICTSHVVFNFWVTGNFQYRGYWSVFTDSTTFSSTHFFVNKLHLIQCTYLQCFTVDGNMVNRGDWL